MSTLWIIASIFGSTLCDWSIVRRTPRLEGTGRDELDEDPEELERVDRADHQVVVTVLAVVEVEPAEPVHALEQRDDLLDVHAVSVMAEIDEHAGRGPELLAERQRRAPVGEIGGVERRLVELVLDEQLDRSGSAA